MHARAALLILLWCVPPAFADLANDITGRWQYDGFFFQDHRYPNPNPHLQVLFTFNADRTARLFWRRDDQPGFCERTGTWRLEGEELVQDSTWFNPANDPSCGQDPDMQPGRSTRNRIAVHDEELDLYMKLDSRDFLYVLKRVPNQD